MHVLTIWFNAYEAVFNADHIGKNLRNTSAWHTFKGLCRNNARFFTAAICLLAPWVLISALLRTCTCTIKEKFKTWVAMENEHLFIGKLSFAQRHTIQWQVSSERSVS